MPDPTSPAEPDADLVDAARAALGAHRIEWIDPEAGWECGCNEHGTLAPLLTLVDALEHQARAVLAVVAAHQAEAYARGRRDALEEAADHLARSRCDTVRALSACPAENQSDYWRWTGQAELQRLEAARLRRLAAAGDAATGSGEAGR